MLKNYLKHSFIAVGYLLLMTLNACKKHDPAPPHPTPAPVTLFADSAAATKAVLGIYTQMNGGIAGTLNFGNGAITLYTGLAGDELVPVNVAAQSPAEHEIYINAIKPNNTINDQLWTNAYQLVDTVNACIEALKASKNISDNARRQLIGESEVVRAFLYFNMVNIWGPVPLFTTTDHQANKKLPRASVSAVYQQIIADLVNAQTKLSVKYPGTGKFRPNIFTANALLARAYLYQGASNSSYWQKAVDAASAVINSSVYSIVFMPTVFLADSKEAIWQLKPTSSTFETTEGNFFNPVTSPGVPKYNTGYLQYAFDEHDGRPVVWLNNTFLNQTYYMYPYKYEQRANGAPAENYVIIRLAEIYLIRAEAYAHLNMLAQASADVNVIRVRSNLSEFFPTTQQQELGNVSQENQRELFDEWGHRWFDMKKTGFIDNVMGVSEGVCASKGGVWKANAALFPIPASQITANPALTQNPGY